MDVGRRPRDLPRRSAPGLDVRRDGGPAGVPVRLTVVGEIDLSTVPLLEAVLEPLIAERPGQVAMDLRGVTFCDVSGLTRLLAARTVLEAFGGELVLHGPCPSLQLLIDLVEPTLELAPPLPR